MIRELYELFCDVSHCGVINYSQISRDIFRGIQWWDYATEWRHNVPVVKSRDEEREICSYENVKPVGARDLAIQFRVSI